MNAEDEEGQGPLLLFGRISCCDAFNITSTQFLTLVFFGLSFFTPQGLSALEKKHNENPAFLLSLQPVPLAG